MELHVAQADLATLPVDAVVVPCNSMGTLTERIRKVLGSDLASIEDELKANAPVAVGAAMVASAASLGAKNAILVPIIKHPGDEVVTELLKRAVKAALIAANMKQYQSVAMPSMIREEAGPTIAEAARAVVQEIRQHDKPFPERVYMVDAEEGMIRIFDEAIEHAHHSSSL